MGAALLAGRPASAQAWPTRPIRIIVPFGIGGSADVAARFLAEPLQQALGQPVIVENRPGAGGTIGAGEIFRAMAGIEITHIPFRGSNEARTALIAGQVPMMFDAIPTMAEQARGGRVRALATTGPRRSPLLPDAPTVAETLPGYEASIWLGVMAPAQTPAPIIERLNAEINRIMSLQATRDAQLRAGAEVNPMTVAAFGDFLRQDIVHQAEGIRISGMKAN